MEAYLFFSQNFGLFTPDSHPQGQRNPQTPVQPETPTRAQLIAANRSAGQRRRRERERLQGNTQRPHALLPTPPQTQTAGPAPPQTGHATNLPTARRPYQEPPDRHDLGRMDQICVECGALHWLMERSTAPGSSNARPLFSMCCGNGDIRLPAIAPPPAQLSYFFTEPTSEAQRFRENIRQYNTALAFTSLGVKVDDTVNTGGGGPPTFRIHGELRHQLGSLLPRDGERPVYAQLYIYDPHTALDHRMHRNTGLNTHTMQRLQDLILGNHRWATTFKNASEVFEQTECRDVSIQLTVNRNCDQRRYNLPTSDEIAVIVPGDGTQSHGYRDIVVHLQDGPLRRISDGSAIYECLQYPLLFIYGEDGYHYDLQMSPTKEDRLSQTDYVAYRIQHRPGEFSLLLRAGRLFQQYLVDMWAAADQNRLNYLRHHQQDIRASLYSGLADAIDRDVDLNDIGQRFILPSSYTGGPRYMKQCLQDSLALARYYRRIDLFITVTCNPAWPEITRELLPGQTATDRPDLCARVFNMKKKAIIEELYKKGIFGRTVAYVYTIEFQKRGLPHMHILIFLKDEDKILTPGDIDTVVWARWPNPDTEPKLFETVKKCMVHSCNDRCLESGKCKKHFPKHFQSHTRIDNEGYPQYCRPDDGHSYNINGRSVDNRWIVPYNPYLSAKFDCHINVECLVSFATLKYVNKYIHKGSDRATLQVTCFICSTGSTY